MKYILIIGDGMAENPLDELGGMTPLERARIPELHTLASKGTTGLVRNVPEGFEPGSDTAIMSIFGCAPRKYYSGRAPLELAALDVFLAPGEGAMRCNNITLSDGEDFGSRLILSHSGGSVPGRDGRALVEYLFSHPEFIKAAEGLGLELMPTDSYRHLVITRGFDLDGIKFSPPHDHLDERVSDNLPAGAPSAEKLSKLLEKAASLLEKHPINEKRRAAGKLPANAVWFWAPGTAAKLPDFFGQYGKTGAVISAVGLVQGIARLAGLDVLYVEGATGELDTNYEGKVACALHALETRDFVCVHVEAPDECSHVGDYMGKIEAIERVSQRVVRPVREALEKSGEDFRMLVLADHKTLCRERIHDGDPVPYIIYDSRRDNKSGAAYTEKSAEAGPFVDDGADLMGMLFEQ